MASGHNAWTLCDSTGAVRHVITPRNADGAHDWSAILDAMVQLSNAPKLTYPNDAWNVEDS